MDPGKARKCYRAMLGICCLRPTGTKKTEHITTIEEVLDEDSIEEGFSDVQGPIDMNKLVDDELYWEENV